MITFTNKTVTIQSQSIPTPISTPISERISTNLLNTFSNLNFAGVYKIGSPTVNRDCYIGSSYNITLKVTHHLNLLYRGEHHSKALQDWVNENGIEAIDITVLAYCKANITEFENMEQYYLNLIKPKFNAILNKRKIKVEFKVGKQGYTFVNPKVLNEFGNPMVNLFSANGQKSVYKITNEMPEENERAHWKPTIILNMGERYVLQRGDFENIKPVKKVEVIETVVRRKGIFTGRSTT